MRCLKIPRGGGGGSSPTHHIYSFLLSHIQHLKNFPDTFHNSVIFLPLARLVDHNINLETSMLMQPYGTSVFSPFSTLQLTGPGEIHILDRNVIAYNGFQNYGLLFLTHWHSQIPDFREEPKGQQEATNATAAEVGLFSMDPCKFNFTVTGA